MVTHKALASAPQGPRVLLAPAVGQQKYERAFVVDDIVSDDVITWTGRPTVSQSPPGISKQSETFQLVNVVLRSSV